MEAQQEILALDNALLDEDLTARIGAALTEAGQTNRFPELLHWLNEARGLFCKLTLHRRRVLNNSVGTWKELRTLLVQIHQLEIRTLAAARLARRF